MNHYTPTNQISHVWQICFQSSVEFARTFPSCLEWRRPSVCLYSYRRLCITFRSKSSFHAPAILLTAANTSNPGLEGDVYLKEAVDGTDCPARL